MKIPSKAPRTSAVNEMSNGLNHEALTCIEPAGEPVYTFTNATIANAARITTSAPRRTTWVRADSSIPRYEIQGMSAIQITAATMIPVVEVAADFQPTSRYVYCAAITASEAITITSATKIAQPLIQPTQGPNAR